MTHVVEEEEKLLVQLHCESSRKGRHILSLRAYEIVDFSSQYGTEDSLSYTADNLLGPPAVYPRTGDHAYSYQLRTYGEWWQILPSFQKTSVNLPYGTVIESQDFVEFRVERRIVPVLLRVYEIYNPGAIVKILSFCYDTEKWVVLWQGKPEYIDPSQSHCFSVTFKGIHYLSDYYRIEFHHKHLKYFCELDGLILYGEDNFPIHFPSYNIPMSGFPKICLKEVTNHVNIDSKKEDNYVNNSQSYFNLLPEEVMILIMTYLDLQSICKAASVSKYFQRSCYEPLLYRHLNLQLYWHLVDVLALKSLQSRLTSLDHLNLSWCGGQGRITPPFFIEFLESTCKFLSVLKISCCTFINNNCMKALASYCQNLKVLEMRCCRAKDLTQSGFKYLSQMPKLMYLDLYRTRIDTTSVLAIVKNCTNLDHLLLGSCTNVGMFDEVARSISKYLKNIKTLDFWRGVSLTCLGIYELAEHCHSLVELDLGWCHKIDANCGCLRQLISHNRNLKKLFLTAIRTVSNNEVNTIASFCKDIEQVDILGTCEINLATIQKFLESCTKLKMLDVSYSDNAVKEAVPALQERFPFVQIKCSTTPLVNY